MAEALGMVAGNKEGWLNGLADAVLAGQADTGIVFGVAFPVEREQDGLVRELSLDKGKVAAYGFYEDIANAERYEASLEQRMEAILADFRPDVVHCFGTEYGHTLAVTRACKEPNRVLIGIQGICELYARVYMADLPRKVQRSVTFRDLLKKDTLQLQQQKFIMRGKMEREALARAGNITGRTHWDRAYAKEVHPQAQYYTMNETLRSNFYGDGQSCLWQPDACEKNRIFISQGDYPIKGLHYMLLALPGILREYPGTKVYVAGNSIVKDATWKDRVKRSAYGRYLRSLIRKYHLEGHVEFLGMLNAREMKEQYLKAELFVCCSALENSPNSLGEAMILGMPCVSADVGGIPTLFSHGVDGILYEGCREASDEGSLTHVVKGLEQAVLAMWADSKQAIVYGRHARERALQTHDGGANYRRLLEIYEDIWKCL